MDQGPSYLDCPKKWEDLIAAFATHSPESKDQRVDERALGVDHSGEDVMLGMRNRGQLCTADLSGKLERRAREAVIWRVLSNSNIVIACSSRHAKWVVVR
jgi:hypothetical protein